MVQKSAPGRVLAPAPEWLVWATVALALLIGWWLQASVVGRSTTASLGASTFSYPATWTVSSADDTLFAVSDPSGGVYGALARLRQLPRAELPLPVSQSSLADVAASWSLLQGEGLEGYRMLNITPTTVQGREAMSVEYAYLSDPPQGAVGGVMPGLMHAIDTLLVSNDQLFVLSVAVESREADRLASLHEQFLAGWRVP